MPDQNPLGTIPTENAVRDAVHIAIVPLIAGEKLYTNEKFRLGQGSETVAFKVTDSVYRSDELPDGQRFTSIGIVDPWYVTPEEFREQYHYWHFVPQGHRFYGILNPNSVTGMTHHWEHPSFIGNVETNPSKVWLLNFCDRWGLDFETVVHKASTLPDGPWDDSYRGTYITTIGVDCHNFDDLGEDGPLFWQYLAVYLGRTFSQDHQDSVGWSCSC